MPGVGGMVKRPRQIRSRDSLLEPGGNHRAAARMARTLCRSAPQEIFAVTLSKPENHLERGPGVHVADFCFVHAGKSVGQFRKARGAPRDPWRVGYRSRYLAAQSGEHQYRTG